MKAFFIEYGQVEAFTVVKIEIGLCQRVYNPAGDNFP